MTSSRAPTARLVNDALLAVVFAVLIGAPWLDGVAGGLDPSPPLVENRAVAERPSWSWSEGLSQDFREAYEAWWNDSFGFRSALVRLDGLVRVLGFGVSTIESAVVGRDGWMYLSDSALTHHVANDLLDNEGVAAWGDILQARQDWFTERGIRHLLVLVPNKHSIYPEHLPDWARRVGDRTRTDQLIEHLAAHSDVEWLDLRPTLLDAKTREPVYERSDTHWNPRGAWFGYRAIAERLATMIEGFTPVEESELTTTESVQSGGDVAKMLGVEPFVEEHQRTWSLPRDAGGQRLPLRGAEGVKDRLGAGLSFAMQRAAPDLPSAVILRDSFTTLLQPLLAEHFSRVAFVGLRDRRLDVPFLPEIIEAEQPDVAITIVVERMLMGNARPVDGEVRIARDSRRFREQGRTVFDAFTRDLAGGFVRHATGVGRPDGVHLTADADPQIVMPTLVPSEWERLAVVADVTVPEDTIFEVHLATGKSGAYDPSLTVTRALTAGRHRFVLPLPNAQLTGPVRVDPGRRAGVYVIHDLQLVRGTPRTSLPGDGLTRTQVFGAELVFDDGRLALRSEGRDPQLRLPALPLASGDNHGLLVDLTVPGPGKLQVFSSPEGASYGELEDAGRSLQAGSNAQFIPLPDVATETPLRVDPGSAPGTTWIDLLAVWSRCDVSWAGDEGTSTLRFENLEVIRRLHTLVLRAKSTDPKVHLPPLRLPPDQDSLLSIDLTVPRDDAAILFLGDDSSSGFGSSVVMPVKAGRNRLMVPLPAGTLRGPWRFDPGRTEGNYALHAFELRTLPLATTSAAPPAEER